MTLDEFVAQKNAAPEATTAIVPPTGTMASSFQKWAEDKDALRGQQAATLSEGFQGRGFDEVAAANEMARMSREELGGPDLPPSFFLDSQLQRTIEMQQAKRAFEKAPPDLVRWSLEDPMNAVLAKGDMQNLSLLGDVVTSMAHAANEVRRLSGPNAAHYVATKRLGALDQNVEDREKTLFDIMREEAAQVTDIEIKPSMLTGLLKAVSPVDLSGLAPANITGAVTDTLWDALTIVPDTAGRYIRSRGTPVGGDEAAIRAQTDVATRRLERVTAIANELSDERARSAAVTRILPRVSKISDDKTLTPGQQAAALFKLFMDDPAGGFAYVATTTAESLPGLALAAVGSRVGVPPTLTMAATSFARAETQSFQQVAKDRGFDVNKPEDVLRMFQDPEAVAAMADDSVRYSAVVAFWDAVSGQAAGQVMASNPVGDILLQTMAQGSLGGFGEAAAQLASGQDVNGVEVAMEFIAEFSTAPVEVLAVGGRKFGQASGAEKALRDMRDTRQQKNQTENERRFFEALATAGDNSTLKPKAPKAYRDAVAAMTKDGPVETVYADASAVDELLQSGKINPVEFEQLTGVSAATVAEQAARGGDIEIATADYAAKVVGTPVADALRDHARVSPDSLSVAEAKALKDTEGGIEATATALAADIEAGTETLAPEVETARATMVEQMVRAGRRPAEAEQQSLLFAAHAQTTASVLGISPAAYLARFPLPQVRTGAAPGPAVEELDQTAAPFREWFGNSVLADETGAPRQVYHAAVGDFDAFREGGIAWVATDPELANKYAAQRRSAILRGQMPAAGPVTVMPLFARVEAPFDAEALPRRLNVDTLIGLVQAQGTPGPDAAAAEAALRAKAGDREYSRVGVWNSDLGDTLAAYLRAQGFDAIRDVEAGVETFGVLDPAQVKSPFNQGTYARDDARVLFQANALREGSETLAKFGLDPAARHNTRDVAVALEARTRKKTGSIDRADRSDKARDKIAKHMVEEVMFEVQQAALDPSTSAVGWYTTKTQRAIDAIGETFPELVGDAEALAFPGPAMLGGDTRAVRAFFTALLAITSDGAKVADNFKRAVQIYGNWRETAVLTAEGAMGSNRGSVSGNLDKLDSLIRTLGPQALWTTLLEPKTISELKKAAKATGVDLGAASQYKATMTLPMSAIVFGPKLGAFYANLMGDTGYLTMDRWWSRTFNRYRGTLIPTLNETGVERVRGLLQAEGVPLSDDATAEEVALAAVPFRNSYAAQGFKNGTETEKAANTLYKAAFEELNDAPFNASDREFMVATVNRAHELLKKRGVTLTVADIQAVLWYYEKRLYGTLGARQTQDVSYEEAARRAAEGYSAGRPADEGAGQPGNATSLDVGADAEFALDDDADGGLTLYQSAAFDRLPDLEKASPGPVPGVRETATRYMISKGLPVRHQAEYVKVDVERAREIARLYDEMEDAPNDPAVRAAYEALARETVQQYEALLELGFTFEFISGADPYASPREAIVDMQTNKHLWVFPTDSGFGTVNEATADHPLLRPTEYEIDGRVALVNDLFRIVHDVFGHGSEGAAFGARGEENAWQAHVRMFSPLAARAMTAETRGQNSWVNFGPHGEANRADPANTVFADQKVGLLPAWVSEVGQAQDRPAAEVLGWPTLEDFTERFSAGLLQRDGWYIVTGMREALGAHDTPENVAANARLRSALDARGLPYTPVSGMYKGEPQGESYLVIGDTAEGLNLGAAFAQESILTFRGLEYSDGRPNTPQVVAETVVGPAALESDFYSVMPDGTPWTMGLDWSEPTTELFQSMPPRMYYSPLLEGVRGAKQAKAKGKDWIAILPKLPGVKEAELVFTGAMDWLEGLRDDTVTRDEVAAFIEAQQVTVEEVRGPGKWEQYAEPNRENYREFLLTVPNLNTLAINEGSRPFVNDTHYSDPNIVVTARTTDRQIDGRNALFAEEVQSDLSSDWRKAGGSWKAREAPVDRAALEREDAAAGAEYRRLRNDLVEALEEYAAEGIDDVAMKNAIAAFARVRYAIATNDTPRRMDQIIGMDFVNALTQMADGQARWEPVYAAFARMQEATKALTAAGPARPYTPFEEAAAYELAVKRLLQRAAQEGYDAFSWTPGYMQARRWDAAAQSVVRGYEWRTAVDGVTREVGIHMQDGGDSSFVEVNAEGTIVHGEGEWIGQPLSAVLGNAAAEIMSTPSGERDGTNILFSSSGYAVAYDRQIKSAVEKIAKRFGAKVSVGKLTQPGRRSTGAAEAQRLVRSLHRADDGGLDLTPLRESGAPAELIEDWVERAVEVARDIQRDAADDRINSIRNGAATVRKFLRGMDPEDTSPEAVRVREKQEAKLADFNARIERAEQALANRQITAAEMRDALRITVTDEIELAFVPAVFEDVWTVEINDAMRAALAQPFPLFQEKRGSLAPSPREGQASALSIFAGADSSTVIHEGAHHFLHVMETLVTTGEAPQRMADDWKALTDWWRSNVDAIAKEAGTDAAHVTRYLDGGTMDTATGLAIWTALHEQTARGFEVYASEGKAPTLGLRSAFEAFRGWLIAVYKTVTLDAALSVQLSDDVRLVFDHWLATDAQIAEATVRGGLDRAAAVKAGVAPGDLDALAVLALEAQEEAKAYMLGLPGPRQAKRLEWRQQRAEALAAARAELAADPAHKAVQWLDKSVWLGDDQPADLPAAKLDRQLIVDVYGDEVAAEIARYTQEGGMDFDDAAPYFGFDSGDAMVQALRTTPSFARAVRARATSNLRAAQAKPSGQDIDDAFNGDKRGQLLAAELRALRKAVAGFPNFTRRQAAVIAEQTIRAMPARAAIKSQTFLAAERRAGRRVEEALAKGDARAAAQAKRDQLIQHSLYSASRKADEMVERTRRRAKRLQSAGTRKNLAGEYLPAIDQVLETYDFRKLARGAELDRTRLAAFVKMMTDAGRDSELAIPQYVLDETKRRPYLTLTVAELEGVQATLVNIEHTARQKNKLRSEQAERDLRATVDAVVAELDANLPDHRQPRIDTPRERFRRGLRTYANIGLNVETRLRQYGGWRLGAAYDAIKAEIDAAGVLEQTMAHERDLKLEALYNRFTLKERTAMARKKQHEALGGPFSQWDLIVMALNMGNAENLSRLMGADTAHPFTEAQIEYVKAQLTDAHWDFVENAWEIIDGYWPLIAARERRATGVAPKKVEAEPFELPSGRVIRGGYYPIKYDGQLSSAVEADQLKEQLKMMQAGRFGKAHTKQGHLETRVGSGGRVLLLDLGVMHQHLADVIHDIAFAEASANAWRILRDDQFRAAMDRKGLRPDVEMLEIWVQDVAVGAQVGGGAIGRFAMKAKSNFTTSRLALNLSTAYLQATGFTHSVAVVGADNMAFGLAQFLGNPGGAWTSVLSQSPFMREKLRLIQPDVAELRMQTESSGLKSTAVTMVDRFIQLGLRPMQAIQTLVDVPTWLAAQRKALRQGMTPEKAALFADRAVIRAQGGTTLADRTAFERGSTSRDTRLHGVIRLWATLASYMMTKGNLAYEIVGTANKERTFTAAMTATGHLFLLFTVEAMVRGLTTGDLWDDDDKDGEADPLKFVLKESALAAIGTMPFVRDIASAANGFSGGGGYGSIVDMVAKPVIELSQGEADKGLAKSIVNVIGLATGLPAGQINRTIDAATNTNDDASFTDYLFGVKK